MAAGERERLSPHGHLHRLVCALFTLCFLCISFTTRRSVAHLNSSRTFRPKFPSAFNPDPQSTSSPRLPSSSSQGLRTAPVWPASGQLGDRAHRSVGSSRKQVALRAAPRHLTPQPNLSRGHMLPLRAVRVFSKAQARKFSLQVKAEDKRPSSICQQARASTHRRGRGTWRWTLRLRGPGVGGTPSRLQAPNPGLSSPSLNPPLRGTGEAPADPKALHSV